MSRSLVPILVLALLCVPALTRADEFSWQLSGGTLHSSLGDQRDTDHSSLDATYYLESVDDAQGPYALAAFLDPATQIGASVSRERLAIPLGGLSIYGLAPELVTTTDDYAVAGRYVLSASKWYAGGRYTKTDIDSSFLSTTPIDAYAYGLVAGKYLGPDTTLDLTADRTSRTIHEFLRICPVGGCMMLPLEVETTIDDLGLGFQHVRRLEKLPYVLSGRIVQTSARSETRLPPIPPIGPPADGSIIVGGVRAIAEGPTLPRYWTYSFAGEVFPTPKLGVRLGYTHVDEDFGPDATYDVAATWFFRRNIGVQLDWSRAKFLVLDEDSYALRFVGRH